MKKLISIGASLMLAASVLATGNEGVNPPQSGVLNPATGVINVTNSFAFPYQTVPLLVIYSAATNGTPITNIFLTTTNFAFSYPVAGSTNASFAWQSFVGGTKLTYGTVISGGGTNVTVTFPFAYAAAPSVVLTGQSTNAANTVGIPSISTTNFTVLSNGNSTNSWISVGVVYNPQTQYQGQNPPNNEVVTP